MAAVLSPDDIDFAAYMRDTECKAKVRRAADFGEDLVSEFAERGPGPRAATMFSSKLRHVLEFRPSEVTTWAGYSGHRKSFFTGQVGLELSAQREKVLMASFEMLPRITLARMARQSFGTNQIGRDSLLHFARWTDNRLWVLDHQGRFDPGKMLAICLYFAHELGGTQVFIDSMMMVCASEESLDEQKRLMTDLVRIADETGLHIHLVAHCKKPVDEGRVPTKYDVRGSAAITDQSHNVVMVWQNKAKKAALEVNPHDAEQLAKPDAIVAIDKQRNGPFEGKLKLWFDDASFRFTDERLTPIEAWMLD